MSARDCWRRARRMRCGSIWRQPARGRAISALALETDQDFASVLRRTLETVADRRHLFFYAQRTADGRIAIGGRGAPYRLGAPMSPPHRFTSR